MLELRGAPALSLFRREKLLITLQRELPQITSVYAEYLHFADVDAVLSPSELDVLQKILQ